MAGAVVTLSSVPRRHVTTEADGSFSFNHLVGRTYSVDAHHGDEAAGPVILRLSSSSEPVILRLRTASSVQVTVIDQSTHKPVTGAHVELVGEAERAGTTDVGGQFTLRGVVVGRHMLDVSALGFAPAHTRFFASGQAGSTDKQTVELRHGAPVSGKVVDTSGKPVAAARVVAMPAGGRGGRFGGGGGGPGRGGGGGEAGPFAGGGGGGFGAMGFAGGGAMAADSVVTDSDGHFTFPALAAGAFRFEATHPAHGPGTSDTMNLDGKAEVPEIVIALQAPARLSGRVVSKSGNPVAGAQVRVLAAQNGGPGRGGGGPRPLGGARQAATDDQGRFELTGLAQQKVEVVALHETGASLTKIFDLAAEPERSDVELILEVDGTISGTVVTAKGDPVPEAEVTAISDEGGLSEMRLRGPAVDVSDSTGKFTLHGLPEGGYRLLAGRGATAAQNGRRRDGVTAQTGDTNVVVTMDIQGTIKGKVLYKDGTAPTSVTVNAGGAPAHFTSGDGSFAIAAGPGGVTLSVSGSDFVQQTMNNVMVDDSGEVDVGTISVVKGRSITGHVYDSQNNPVSGATVMAGPQVFGNGDDLSTTNPNVPVQTASSDTDGSYWLPGLDASRNLVLGRRRRRHRALVRQARPLRRGQPRH